MDCSRTRRLLSAYVDCELPAERRSAVRRHLHGCPECQAVLDGYKNLAALTDQWSELATPASWWDRLSSKLQAGCAAAAALNVKSPVAVAESSRPSRPARVFRPMLEGLEDRYPPTDLWGAASVAWSPPPMTAAVAMFHAAMAQEIASVGGYGDLVLA